MKNAKSKTSNEFATEIPTLLKGHYDQLRAGSGLSLKVIRERGYKSIVKKKELRDLGFAASQLLVPGLLLPVCSPDGRNSLYCYRPDVPRRTNDGKELKYEFPRGSAMRLDVPPRCRAALADPAVPFWITEGVKKADALATHRLTAVALLGVWNFKGKNEFGGVTLLADFDHIAFNERTVNIVFDSDIITKPQVQKALDRLAEHLGRKGAQVKAVYLPAGQNGCKVGVDDYLRQHDVGDLEALIGAPRPAPKPKPPVIELLDEAPPVLRRPLDIVQGRAYAVSWVWIQRRTAEVIGDDGRIVQLDPPALEKIQQRIVVRDDGAVFGANGKLVFGADDEQSLQLGFEVRLDEQPRDAKMWRGTAVDRYRSGARPSIPDLFGRIVSVFDHFLDFARSVADQRTMSEFSALAVLVT